MTSSSMGEWQGVRFVTSDPVVIRAIPSGHMGFMFGGRDVTDWSQRLDAGSMRLDAELRDALYGDDAPFCVIHPGMAWFLTLTPRERWQIDHRVQRMARRGYTPEFIVHHRYG